MHFLSILHFEVYVLFFFKNSFLKHVSTVNYKFPLSSSPSKQWVMKNDKFPDHELAFTIGTRSKIFFCLYVKHFCLILSAIRCSLEDANFQAFPI